MAIVEPTQAAKGRDAGARLSYAAAKYGEVVLAHILIPIHFPIFT